MSTNQVPINDLTSTNPLKEARLSSGMTQNDLAIYAGVTPGAVLKYEQGLYENPSNKILTVLSSRTGTPRKDLIREYKAWRTWKRAHAYLRPVGLLRFDLTEHPLTVYRIYLGLDSTQALCRLLCMHPATVGKYQRAECRSMPLLVKEALFEGGLGPDDIDVIHRKGQEYYDYWCD